MLRYFILSLTFIALFATPVFSGSVYTWTDENGVTHFGDKPPKYHKGNVQSSSARDTGYKPKVKHKVELYVTSWCPSCKVAQKYFRDKGIYVNVFNVESSGSAARRKARLSNNSPYVPFAVVNGEKIVGFKPGAYDAALKKGPEKKPE